MGEGRTGALRLAALVIGLTATGCAGGEPRGSEPVDPGDPGDPAVTGRAAAAGTTRLPGARASWPRLETVLPRRVPTGPAGLDRLVDDPPRRATMVYHPPERWDEPVEGWASETLLFHGVDGRWRVLDLDELGLPRASWPGHDTYGSGSLSPDGRWWAGQSRLGVIVLDVGTGRAELVRLGSRWTAWVEWRGDSRSLLAAHGDGALRTELITFPGARRAELPHAYWQVDVAPDGRTWSSSVPADGILEVAEWLDGTWVSRGEVGVPGLLRRPHRDGLSGLEASGDRFLLSVQRPPWRTIDLAIIDAKELHVESRLHLTERERRDHVGAEWLDRETVLLTAGPGLIAWRPDDGTFHRVTTLPEPGNGYATLDVATGLAASRGP